MPDIMIEFCLNRKKNNIFIMYTSRAFQRCNTLYNIQKHEIFHSHSLLYFEISFQVTIQTKILTNRTKIFFADFVEIRLMFTENSFTMNFLLYSLDEF